MDTLQAVCRSEAYILFVSQVHTYCLEASLTSHSTWHMGSSLLIALAVLPSMAELLCSASPNTLNFHIRMDMVARYSQGENVAS